MLLVFLDHIAGCIIPASRSFCQTNLYWTLGSCAFFTWSPYHIVSFTSGGISTRVSPEICSAWTSHRDFCSSQTLLRWKTNLYIIKSYFTTFSLLDFYLSNHPLSLTRTYPQWSFLWMLDLCDTWSNASWFFPIAPSSHCIYNFR